MEHNSRWVVLVVAPMTLVLALWASAPAQQPPPPGQGTSPPAKKVLSKLK